MHYIKHVLLLCTTILLLSFVLYAKAENVSIPQSRSSEQIVQDIKEIEASHGAFHIDIADELLALGMQYQEQSNYELAYDTFKRSLEIQRINTGLYNETQFPVVRQLVLTSRALEKWSNVNKYLEYLLWLHQRLYDRQSPKMLPILDTLIGWKIESINRRLVTDPQRSFDDARDLARRYNDIVEANPDLKEEPIYFRVWDGVLQKSTR